MNKICKTKIEDGFYRSILEVLPIVCVDVLLVKGDKFLMGKRVNEPAKGQWWFPGGRVLKGETLREAAIRQARKIGCKKPIIQNLITAQSVHFDKSAQGVPIDEIGIVYWVDASGAFKPKDNENSSFKWFKRANSDWHTYLLDVLTEAGYPG